MQSTTRPNTTLPLEKKKSEVIVVDIPKTSPRTKEQMELQERLQKAQQEHMSSGAGPQMTQEEIQQAESRRLALEQERKAKAHQHNQHTQEVVSHTNSLLENSTLSMKQQLERDQAQAQANRERIERERLEKLEKQSERIQQVREKKQQMQQTQ